MRELVRVVVILCISSCVLWGCMDKDYDLNKGISSDMLLAKNGLFLPIGSSDSVTLKKLMKNANVTGLQVENGKYYVWYGDSLYLNLPTQSDIKISDLNGLNGSTQITGNDLTALQLMSQAPLPNDLSYNLNQNIGPFKFNTSTQITRLDSVIFNTSESKVNITLNTQDLSVLSGIATVNLSLTFPAAFTIIDPATGKVLTNNTYNISYSLGESNKTISLILASFKDNQPNYTISSQATLLFKKGAQIKVGSNPGFDVNVNFNSLLFKRIYGLFNTNISSNAGQTSFKGLYDFITGKDNILSFSQPRLFVTTKSNIGIPINVNLNIDAKKNGSVITSEQTSLAVSAASVPEQTVINNFGIGPQIEPNWAGKTWNYTNVGNLLKNMPDVLSFSINAASDLTVPQHFYTDDAFMQVKYEAKIPLAVASDFKITLADTVQNVFTKDIVTRLFSSGDAGIYGLVQNSIPLNMKLLVRILDENNNDTGVVIAPQTVSSGNLDGTPQSTTLAIVLSESEMEKMQNAKNVELTFVFTSSDSIKDITLKQSDFVSVRLFMKKDGGINLNL